MSGTGRGTVDLYWIPLGAGARFVRFNGVVYEALSARLQRRPRRPLYHSALALDLPHGHYMVEMTPVPDARGSDRGVVTEGAVGLRLLGRLRVFRYEVRRWRDGVVPDLGFAVASPVRVTDDAEMAQRMFDVLPHVPPLVWGRDRRHVELQLHHLVDARDGRCRHRHHRGAASRPRSWMDSGRGHRRARRLSVSSSEGCRQRYRP